MRPDRRTARQQVPNDRGCEASTAVIPDAAPTKHSASVSTLALGCFVAVPAVPLIVILHVPVDSGLIALVTAAAAAANRSKVVYQQFFRA